MGNFFRRLLITVLSRWERENMEAPITLEELQLAVAGMANQKSPSPEGLLVETYKYYG